jgi:hypothetical protein
MAPGETTHSWGRPGGPWNGFLPGPDGFDPSQILASILQSGKRRPHEDPKPWKSDGPRESAYLQLLQEFATWTSSRSGEETSRNGFVPGRGGWVRSRRRGWVRSRPADRGSRRGPSAASRGWLMANPPVRVRVGRAIFVAARPGYIQVGRVGSTIVLRDFPLVAGPDGCANGFWRDSHGLAMESSSSRRAGLVLPSSEPSRPGP